jgi:putative copper resistance protein D
MPWESVARLRAQSKAMTMRQQQRSARMTAGMAWGLGALPVAGVASLITASNAVPGVLPPSAVVVAGVAVARVLLVGAITATLGLNVLPLLFSPREQAVTTPARLRAYRAGGWTALCWMVCAIASVYLQTADLAGTSSITAGELGTYVSRFGSGQSLAGQVVVAAVAIAAAASGARSGTMLAARILVLCSVAGLLLLVAAGHAGEASEQWHDMATVSLELHVFAAALWTGGLGAIVMLLAADRALLSRALPRYSPLATGCLAVVGVSGLLNAAVALSAKPGTSLLSELLTTDYGRLVILKAGCLCALACIGGHIRFRLLPAIRQAHRTSVALWGCFELGIMGVAFGLAAVLGRSAA